jgi:LAO/AO transport system kinase
MNRASELLSALLNGEGRALARAISWMENGHPEAAALLRGLWPHLGRATVVGLTGAPGAGKSTLTDRLAQVLRKQGLKVGILAVDPSSPFSGGAILGDRIRMQRIAPDPGVFIRSMATRGALGGLARATQDAIDVLDGAGFDWILVETVGVGQDEVDVVSCVHSCVVVLVPGMGDEIQALKAGLMEVADLFVINKADRDGADQVEAEVEALKSMSPPRPWDPPILRTVAAQGQGVGELVEGIRAHGVWLREQGALKRKARERARLRVEALLAQEAVRRVKAQVGETRMADVLERVATGQQDPYTAVATLFPD